ncbi:hypothetical protein C0991_000724 [Blastosporella zonata]|nr:hypothetical protein C0991_000724 [Blastosporella zonata]
MEDQDTTNDTDDEDDRDANGEDLSNPIDDLYNAIPTEYRRCTLLSHALKLILTHCGDNATLLTRLLDVTLDHKLDYESTSLLQSLVSLAATRSPSNTPPICHSTHSNFFIDVYTRWTASGLPETTFFRIFIKALEVSRDRDIYASKAVNNIVQVMHTRDFASYLQFICVSSVLAVESRGPTLAPESEATEPLLPRISLWLKPILVSLPSTTTGWEALQALAKYSDDICELLVYILPLVCNTGVPELPERLGTDIQTVLLSLSVQWLAVRGLPLQKLIEKLSVTLPHASTFTPLVAKAFADSDGCLDAFRSVIQDLSTTLSLSNLLHLNASLLACALRYIEQPSYERKLATRSTTSEIQHYRHQLITLADEAEDRFVRPRAKSLVSQCERPPCPITTPLRREMFRDISEWEPRSGMWLLKSEDRRSARKKRKMAEGRISFPLRSQRSGNLGLPPNSGHAKVQASNGHKPMFSALLSSAAAKRAMLHPPQKLPCVRSQSEARDVSANDMEGSDDDFQPVSFSDDDALDLFGWTSSPVKNT